jgi:hypothetical protein
VKVAKKAALGALAATVMALVTPMTSASADQGDTLKGGCGFNTDENAVATNGANQGTIYVAAVSQEASGGPSTATVSCWIDVNGVEQGGTRLTVTANGVIAGQQSITYSSIPGDSISECQQVTFADGSTWTAADGNVGTDCPAATEVTFPPQAVIDLLNTAIDTINGVLAALDPVFTAANTVLCPLLQTLGTATGGGVAGVITIDPATGNTSIQDPLGLLVVTYTCV